MQIHHRTGRLRLPGTLLLLTAGCLLLDACHKAPTGDPAPASDAKPQALEKPAAGKNEPAAKTEAGANEVTLTTEQIEKLGVQVEAASATDFADETPGYGVVMGHEIIAQAVAELATAGATERLSRAALQRARKLSGTPGAVSADVEETAVQKAEVDAAALTLTTQRLSAMLGMRPPWKNNDKDPTLQRLANGMQKLVRVTFPIGALSGGTPASLRAAHIGAGTAGRSWKMSEIWDAPADANVPGRSFFAILKDGDAGEGERLQVWAPIGETTAGVVIPAASTVMSGGKYWCYVEKEPGTFERVEIGTTRPTPDGYFVTEGVSTGDKVVTSAAGQLLAKESASGAESD